MPLPTLLEAVMVCSTCQHRNKRQQKRCERCGSPLTQNATHNPRSPQQQSHPSIPAGLHGGRRPPVRRRAPTATGIPVIPGTTLPGIPPITPHDDCPPASTSDSLCGMVLGRCRLQSQLGQGGMGSVYRARHLNLQIDVVIKVLAPDLASNQKLIARFTREARSTAQIDHPNIVRVYDLGQEDGRFFIIMQFIDGEDLQLVLQRRGQLPWREATRVIIESSKGLAFAHDHGIIHRDIKPDNIMLSRQGEVKVADFGLAKNLAGEVPITRSGGLLGTPHFMSPEQCQGTPTDRRTDIYSLGITFYQLITGKLPFTGETFTAVLYKQVHDPLPIHAEQYPDIPAELWDIMRAMTVKSRDQRIQNAGELPSLLARLGRSNQSTRLRAYVDDLSSAPSSSDATTPVTTPQVATPTGRIPAQPPGIKTPSQHEPASAPPELPHAAMGSATTSPPPLSPPPDHGPSPLIQPPLARDPSPEDGDSTPDTPRSDPASLDSTAGGFWRSLVSKVTSRLQPRHGAKLETSGKSQRGGAPRMPAGIRRGEHRGEFINQRDGSVLMLVEAGSLHMGSDAHEHERPPHQVHLTAYLVGREPVTNNRYRQFLDWITTSGDHERCHPNEPPNKDHAPDGWETDTYNRYSPGEDHPVVNVDWFDAWSYAAWARLRLLTEAEWERAARGDDSRLYPWGDTSPEDGDYAQWERSKGDHRYTAPVTAHPLGRSPMGCVDMAGNVLEWCEDWFHPTFYQRSPGHAPINDIESGRRCVRGGSWNNVSTKLRTSARSGLSPLRRDAAVSFRCGRTPLPPRGISGSGRLPRQSKH